MSISFDRAAEYYDDTRGFPLGTETTAAATIAQAGGFQGAERVLEIGVGTGRIALPVAPHVRHYTGIDISTAMMRRLLDKRGGEAVAVAEADATRLPFGDQVFDAAVAVHIFHLIVGWQQALVELARVLKPDARLVHCWTVKDQAIDVEAILKPEGGGRANTVGARGSAFLEEAGWRVLGEETLTFTRQQRPMEIIENMRTRVWSGTWRLTDKQLNTSIATLQRAIDERYADANAPVEVQSVFHAKAYAPPVGS
jgi:ubiquinone/menaquinone biosynthesis C-methylase UbiE